jgi:hypothetical protein
MFYRFPRLKSGFILLQLQEEFTKHFHVVTLRQYLDGLIHPRVNPWYSVFDRINNYIISYCCYLSTVVNILKVPRYPLHILSQILCDRTLDCGKELGVL